MHTHDSPVPDLEYGNQESGYSSSITLPPVEKANTPPTSNHIVDFDGPEDPLQPLNWPVRKKITATLLYGLTTAGSTWASSVYSPATTAVASEFGVSAEVSTLGLTLFMFGYVDQFSVV
jgi:hypothetical protein